MAHKKGVGSTKNGRDSESKRLGVKRGDGQLDVYQRQLYACADAFYRPQNMALAVAGNVTMQQVLDAVERAAIPEKTGVVERIPVCEPRQVAEKLSLIHICNESSLLTGRFKIHISVQLSICAAVDSHIDDHCAGFDHITGDEPLASHSCHQNIRPAADLRQILCTGMAQRHSGILRTQQQRHGFSHNIGAAHHNSVLALHGRCV